MCLSGQNLHDHVTSTGSHLWPLHKAPAFNIWASGVGRIVYINSNTSYKLHSPHHTQWERQKAREKQRQRMSNIYSSLDGHLSCLHGLSTVNPVTVNTRASMWCPNLHSFGYFPRSGMFGPMIWLFAVFQATTVFYFYCGCVTHSEVRV
jgi:hypothetical protein